MLSFKSLNSVGAIFLCIGHASSVNAADARVSISIALPQTSRDRSEAFLAGASKAANDLSASLKINVLPDKSDLDTKRKFLEALEKDRPDAVVLDSNGLYEADTVGEYLRKTHTKIIAIDPTGVDDNFSAKISSDFFGSGVMAADFMRQITSQGTGDVALISSGTSQNLTDQRSAGFSTQLAKYPDLKIVLNSSTADPSQYGRIASSVVNAFPKLDGIFATSEAATIGAVQAVEEKKDTDQIKIIGTGYSKSLQELLDQEKIAGLLIPDYYTIGYEAVKVAYATTKGETPSRSIEVPAKLIVSTRRFMERHDYPPVLSAAYGIIAFTQLSTPDQKDRLKKICHAYIATFPSSTETGAPIEKQMITVWPLDSNKSVLLLSNNKDSATQCELAVLHYDLPTSLTALKEAALTAPNTHLDGLGPYMLAWSPSSMKGHKDTLVLVRDLSTATTEEQYLEYFREWRTDIEQNPSLWNNGWSLEKLRLAIRDWADKTGTLLLPYGLIGEKK